MCDRDRHYLKILTTVLNCFFQDPAKKFDRAYMIMSRVLKSYSGKKGVYHRVGDVSFYLYESLDSFGNEIAVIQIVFSSGQDITITDDVYGVTFRTFSESGTSYHHVERFDAVVY